MNHNIKRFLSLLLVVISLLSIAMTTASANSLLAVPGSKRVSSTITCTAGSKIDYTVWATLNDGEKVNVFLDVFNPQRDFWVLRDSCCLSGTGRIDEILAYALDTDETKVRIRTYGFEANTRNITVFYH